MTARLVGHYIGDAEQYRRPGEVDEARRREPVARLSGQLRAAGVDETVIEGAERDARAEIERAAAEALAAPLADPATAKDHLYV